MAKRKGEAVGLSIGVDVSDKYSHACVLDEDVEIIEETRLRSTPAGFKRYFGAKERAMVTLEAGTHSPVDEPAARWARTRRHGREPAEARADRKVFPPAPHQARATGASGGRTNFGYAVALEHHAPTSGSGEYTDLCLDQAPRRSPLCKPARPC